MTTPTPFQTPFDLTIFLTNFVVISADFYGEIIWKKLDCKGSKSDLNLVQGVLKCV